MTSVILIEDSALFRSAIHTVLREAGLRVRSFNSKSFSNQAVKKSDAVLFDVVTFSGSENGIEKLVRRGSACGPVLLLGREDRVAQIIRGLRAGAVGAVSQTLSARALRRSIMNVAAGGTWFERTLFRKVVEHLPRVVSGKLPQLTRRQAEVLRYLVRGQRNKEIAQRMHLSVQSIKFHVSRLLKKTGKSSRTSLSILAVGYGVK